MFCEIQEHFTEILCHLYCKSIAFNCMLLEISFYKNDVNVTETVINQGYCSLCKIFSVKSCVI